MGLRAIIVETSGFSEYFVREVVIFVDKEVYLLTYLSTTVINKIKLLHGTVTFLLHSFPHPAGQIFGISVAEHSECGVTMCVKCLAVVVKFGIHNGEVQVYHKILVVLRCGMVADVESLVEHVELIGIIHVVVMAQHRQGEALAETARTDKEEKLVGALYLLDIAGFVYIITAVAPYRHEVHHAVGDSLGVSLLILCILCHNLPIVLSYIMIFRKVMDFP